MREKGWACSSFWGRSRTHTPRGDCIDTAPWQHCSRDLEFISDRRALLCPQGPSIPGGMQAALWETISNTVREQACYRTGQPGKGAWEGSDLEPAFLVTGPVGMRSVSALPYSQIEGVWRIWNTRSREVSTQPTQPYRIKDSYRGRARVNKSPLPPAKWLWSYKYKNLVFLSSRGGGNHGLLLLWKVEEVRHGHFLAPGK